MFNEIKLGIIGAGKWGINHIRTANKLLGQNLKIVADLNPLRELEVTKINPEINFSTDISSILDSSEINCVIISTPAELHFELSKLCLENNKNILVEKPITLNSAEAKELINISEINNLKLMVGHVLLFHPAVRKMKELIRNVKIGNIQYIYSNRLNLGAIRSEENILWSFAPHDISVIQYLIEQSPVFIYAAGSSFVQRNIEDTTLTYLKFPSNVHAHIFVSWLHPFKEQRMVVIGNKGMLVFEDSLKTEKLKFYPKGFTSENGVLKKFEGDYEVIDFPVEQPLEEEQKHFFDCVINDKTPLTNGIHALEVLQILEEASKNLKEN
ncbi:MAG: Gfo/Idh/MocA family oxidoreductase [Ignavibacteria bacterium]|nr:Gfo/Idh/MocA family oxidoreductase [Ignavibacteria bacterium]